MEISQKRLIKESVNKVSVLTVIVGGGSTVLIRPLADTDGGNGAAPFAQLVLELPVPL